MRVAVIGAGVGGLTAAYRLTQAGHAADVYERWPGLGGQAATIDVGGGTLLERYYHVLLVSDDEIANLYDEVGLGEDVEWLPSRMANFAGGRVHPFTTPLDLLRFDAMSLVGRLRLGAAYLWMQMRHRKVDPFEDVTAKEWVERHMGREAYATVWGPLLHGKFYERADEISMAWLWSKLLLRREIKPEQGSREVLGYPKGSWEILFRRLQQLIEDRGGRVLIDRPVARLARHGDRFVVTPAAPGSFRRGHDPREFEALAESEHYDRVIATVPSDVFEQLLDPALAAELSPDFRWRLGACEYHTALCLLLELDRPLTSFYWTNICDTNMPFIGIVEPTNLVSPSSYDGRRFCYVANYLPPDHSLLALDRDELMDAYEPGLRAVNPRFSRDWVKQSWHFREPAAQPIITTGYQHRVPPLQSGVPGLVLCNTTQVYPEDRGTNYAVDLADQAVAAVLAAPAPPARPGS